jgi:hypothetical protein
MLAELPARGADEYLNEEEDNNIETILSMRWLIGCGRDEPSLRI